MPADFAHYRFGMMVLEKLSDEVRQPVFAAPDCFALGLQGPDIFFFYKPFRNNRVNQVGQAVHAAPGCMLFEPAAEILNKTGSIPQKSYVIGLLCHFILDSECHPFVNEQVAQHGALHTELEADFERTFMMSEGIQMERLRPATSIKPLQEYSFVIAPFFPDCSARQVYRSYKSMRRYKTLLWAPTAKRNALLLRIMRRLGLNEEICQTVVSIEPNPKYAQASKRLLEITLEAVPKTVTVIEEYLEAVEKQRPLSDRIDVCFD